MMRRALLPAITTSILLTSCSSSAPSTLDPEGPGAERVAGLWWFMLSVAAVVVLLVGALILVGAIRRRHVERGEATPRWAMGMVLGGGVVLPVVVLSVLWGFTLRDTRDLSTPPEEPSLVVDVIGHRWWWEVRYPDEEVVTANDIHIPAGETVEVRLRSDDVIHSFWVPELSGKTDMIPGRTNAMWIKADRPGTYRGQCAEFCGLQHANMIVYVVAEPRAEFDEWITDQRRVRPEPTEPILARGLEIFLAHCAGCHAIRGTDADGTVGPELSDVSSRLTLGAGAIEHTPEAMRRWIRDPQDIKPGVIMPPFDLPEEDLDALVAYLETLA